MNRYPSMLSVVTLLLLGGVGHASMGDVLRNNRVEAGFAALNSALSTGEELETGSGEEDREAEATEADPTLFGSPYETAHFYYRHGEYEDAIEQFLIYLQEPEPEADMEKLSLVRLAESFYRQGALTQSVSILDLYLKQHPDDGMRAEILFQSGLIYREMGLFEEAISQFYRVLNSIVVTAESDLPRYLSLARRSQFEIAIGHFDKGEYGQALALLERLNPSELNPLDRETLHYYRARATVGAGAFREGLTLVESFVESYPKSGMLPEMLYEQEIGRAHV